MHFTIFAQEKPIMSKSSQPAFAPGKYGSRVQNDKYGTHLALTAICAT